LLKKDFEKQFENETLDLKKISQWLNDHKMATPHSQRSSAQVFLKGLPLSHLEKAINLLEGCQALPSIKDFSVKVSHYESLHAHDAVGWISKSGRPEPLMI